MENEERKLRSYYKRKVKELNLIDDFLFTVMATDDEYAVPCLKVILSVLLEKEIKDIIVHGQKILPGDDTDLRGVRLDVEVIESEDGNVANLYDIEPHTQNDLDFPRHNRYYQAKIDGHHVDSGLTDFSKIPNLYVITITNFDIFGEDKFDGMHFQEKLEEKAYAEGTGKVPVQTLIDYKNDKVSTGPLEVLPAIKGEYVYANNRNVLPDILNQDIIEAFSRYGQIIKGFDTDGALLCGVETRTSSPVKILRDEDFMSNMKGLYPCGEGAGYAGGITSAALDGLKVAEKVVLRYN